MQYYELCDNNIIVLSQCRRADDELYNMCLPHNIKKINTKDFGQKIRYRNLCYTNKKRIEINDLCMKKFIEKRWDINKLSLSLPTEPCQLLMIH